MNVKNILWFDDKKGENDIVKYFNKYQGQVNYVDSFDDFFGQVSSMNIYNYDLIVLDVDLTELSEEPDEDGKSDKERFKDNMRTCVTITNDDIDIEKSAGVLIYLYLALNRYPRDRICFLTGNDPQYIEEVFKKCQLSMPNKSNIKTKNPELSVRSKRQRKGINWDEFYYNSNDFYQFRYLTRNMCMILWKWLDSFDAECDDNIWRNQNIKYKNNTQDKHDKSEFQMMLKSIKNRLSNIKPISREEENEVYIDIVNEITSLAECFSKQNKNRYDSILKVIRNTMAHKSQNLKKDIDSKLCIFICMIGFRIYFDFDNFVKYSEYINYEYIENKALEFISGSPINNSVDVDYDKNNDILIDANNIASRFFGDSKDLINNRLEIYQMYCSINFTSQNGIELSPKRREFIKKCKNVVIDKIRNKY